MSYLADQVKGQSHDFITGFKLGIVAYAHLNNVVEFLGNKRLCYEDSELELKQPDRLKKALREFVQNYRELEEACVASPNQTLVKKDF